jgi:hypothetical protein
MSRGNLNLTKMKKHFLTILSFAVILFTTASCATIFSGTKADVKITSNPPNLKVYSVNKEQQLTELGVTPCIVTIKKKTPYLVVQGEGYYEEKYDVSSNAKVEPTYWVNILNAFFGGLLVDIPSGAYINPQSEVNFEMKKKY